MSLLRVTDKPLCPTVPPRRFPPAKWDMRKPRFSAAFRASVPLSHLSHLLLRAIREGCDGSGHTFSYTGLSGPSRSGTGGTRHRNPLNSHILLRPTSVAAVGRGGTGGTPRRSCVTYRATGPPNEATRPRSRAATASSAKNRAVAALTTAVPSRRPPWLSRLSPCPARMQAARVSLSRCQSLSTVLQSSPSISAPVPAGPCAPATAASPRAPRASVQAASRAAGCVTCASVDGWTRSSPSPAACRGSCSRKCGVT